MHFTDGAIESSRTAWANAIFSYGSNGILPNIGRI